MPSLSLDHLTIVDATPLELIHAAAAGGFETVGLRIVRPMAAAAIVEVIGQPELQRDLKALMASTGVSVGLIDSIWLSADTNPSELEPALLPARILAPVAFSFPATTRMRRDRLPICAALRSCESVWPGDCLRIHAVYASPQFRTRSADHAPGGAAQSPPIDRRAAYKPFGERPADARQARFLDCRPTCISVTRRQRSRHPMACVTRHGSAAFIRATANRPRCFSRRNAERRAYWPGSTMPRLCAPSPIECGRIAGRITRAWLQRHEERR